MKKKLSKNFTHKKRIPIIISMLFHAILFLLFVILAFKKTQNFIIIKHATQKNKIQPQPRQAILFPKKSDNGSTVVFDDRKFLTLEPEKANPKIRKLVSESKKIINEKTKEKIKEKAVVKIKQYSPKIKKPIPKQYVKQIKNMIQDENSLVQDEKCDIKKLALKNLLKEKEKKLSETINQKEKQESTTTKQKKSLLSLTKCFLDHPQGNSCLIRKGETKYASLEEIKYICYEKQIHDQIVTTFKILYNGVVPQRNGSVHFTFLINESGNLDEVQLIESSGNQTFDEMVINTIKEAAPFPEIPKHFGMKKYRPRGGIIQIPF